MSSVCTSTESPRTSADLRRRWSTLLRPQDHAFICIAYLAISCGVLFFYGLNGGELFRTESLRAILAAEFLRSGNWIVPVLYGEPFVTKPPGMYAAIALCSWPFGQVTEWTARLPSALAATATVFLIYWYVSRQAGRLGGLLAAVILPLSPLWLEKGTSAEIDMFQVFWTTGAIVFLLRALDEYGPSGGVGWTVLSASANAATDKNVRPTKELSFRWWLAAWLCVAGGFLTKWTTPAFFVVTLAPLLWWRGQLHLLWRRENLIGASVCISICLAWLAAAISMTGWPVFAATMEREAMYRLVPSSSPRPYPWMETLIHPLKLMLVGMPFSFAALIALRPSFYRLWDERGKRLLQALHCWTWPNMLFWSLPTEHTPRHSFPLIVGLSGLAAMVLLAWLTGKLPWRWRRLKPKYLVVATLLFWILLKVTFVEVVMPHRMAERRTREKAGILASLIPLGEILYIFHIKDEGIMFYYGREVLRLNSVEEMPRQTEPVYCVLLPHEMERWQSRLDMRVLRRMTDSQGDQIIVVRVKPG